MGSAAGPARSAVHLTKRFFGAIKPGPPAEADTEWALESLQPAEQQLWLRMSNPDRRHSVGVARSVVAEIGRGAQREVVAAGLLHDVGKIECELRTPGRVVATLVWAVVPDDRADKWLQSGRPFRKLAQYRRHPEIGERLLVNAGSEPVTFHWAGDHHKAEADWRVDPAVGAVLESCDDD